MAGKLSGWAPDAFDFATAGVTDDHVDTQVKMGEAMSHRAGQRSPIGFPRCVPLGRRPWPWPIAPRCGRYFHQSTEESLVGPAPQENRAIRAQQRESETITSRPGGPRRSPGQLVGARASGAGLAHGAVLAARLFRQANGGAEVHHGLGVIAGSFLRRQRGRELAQVSFALRQGFIDIEQSRNDPLDVAIDDRGWLVEGDGGDRRCRVRANSWQRAKCSLRIRKPTTMSAANNFRAMVQVSRARIVAKPLPSVEHLVEGRRRQRFETRPSPDKRTEIGFHRRRGGLLQHNFAQPYPVGVHLSTGRGAPRELALIEVVPFQQYLGMDFLSIRQFLASPNSRPSWRAFFRV